MATPLTTTAGGGGGGGAVMAGHVDKSGPLNRPIGGVKGSGSSPIRIFLFFHEAIRKELDVLHRSAMAIATNKDTEIKPFMERCYFLRSIYKHHCNAEDEVRFNFFFSFLFLKSFLALFLKKFFLAHSVA